MGLFVISIFDEYVVGWSKCEQIGVGVSKFD